MNAVVRTLRAYGKDARDAFRIAPVEVLLGVIVALGASASMRAGEAFTEESWATVLAWGWISFPPVLGLTVLHLRGAIGRWTRFGGTAAVLLLVGAYAFGMFTPERTAEIWRFACLMLAGISFVLLTPAMPTRIRDRQAHWRFAFGVLARAIGVAAYAAVLFGALAGAVASVVNLFELPEPEHLYGDMAAWIFLAAAPWLLVGGVRRLVEEAGREEPRAPLAVVRFGRFVYAPILVVYLLILYAYGLRVLVTQELPKNLVSPLVLAAGLLGMAGALLLEPVHRDREQRGLSLLVRWVPALLLPLLPFAFVAILMRQGQYGWTEFRYLRLAGTVMLTLVAMLGTVWLVRGRTPPLASVPGILALGMFLVSVGPWSAQAVSRRDQQARLVQALREAGVQLPVRARPGNVSADTVTVTREQEERIRGGVRYLAEAHGMRAVAAVLGPDALRWERGGQLADALPMRVRCTPAQSWSVHARLAGRTPVVVPGGRLVQVLDAPYPSSAGDLRLQVDSLSHRVRLQVDGRRLQADLRELVASVARGRTEACGEVRAQREPAIEPQRASSPLTGQDGQAGGVLVVTDLFVRRDSAWTSVPVRIQRVGGVAILP